MTYAAIVYNEKDHVAQITLNRPGAGNTIDRQLAGRWKMFAI